MKTIFTFICLSCLLCFSALAQSATDPKSNPKSGSSAVPANAANYTQPSKEVAPAIGIGKPAPATPPTEAVVQSPVERVLTPEDKANAAKSMEAYEKQLKSAPATPSRTVRPPSPSDAVAPLPKN